MVDEWVNTTAAIATMNSTFSLKPIRDALSLLSISQVT